MKIFIFIVFAFEVIPWFHDHFSFISFTSFFCRFIESIFQKNNNFDSVITAPPYSPEQQINKKLKCMWTVRLIAFDLIYWNESIDFLALWLCLLFRPNNYIRITCAIISQYFFYLLGVYCSPHTTPFIHIKTQDS